MRTADDDDASVSSCYIDNKHTRSRSSGAAERQSECNSKLLLLFAVNDDDTHRCEMREKAGS